MRIAADGTWYYGGSPIGRKELVCLFASVLNRDDDGDYWLITPVEKARIQVEDAPFAAVEMFVDGSGGDQTLSFRTNVDEIVTIDEAHPLALGANAKPYITVRGGLTARLTRAVYYDLVARGIEETIDGDKVYGVWSSNRFFALGKLEDE